MDRQSFLTLTTSSQWILFIALALIIYSWIDKKIKFQVSGQIVFVALAVYAIWIIVSKQIIVPEVAAGIPAPPEARALTFFSGLIACGIFAAIGLLLNFLKSTYAKIPNLILVPFGIFLFFMVYQLQRI